MPNQVRVGFGITGASKASSDLDKLKDKITGIQKAGLGGVSKGIAIGVGIGVVNATTRAVAGLGDAIGDAMQAAVADQASQQKLNSSLKANVAGWDGNTKAIERTLEARMALGFSDDEQRDSLAKLTAATGDVNKALALQRTAMDLARFSGKSLEDATGDLVKVQAGSFRALKGLGIELDKNATSAEALAAIQKVVTGQAKDYASTMAGKVLVAQTKMNEAMEKLGYIIAPAAADAMSGFVDVLEGVGSGVENVGDVLGDFADAFHKEFLNPVSDALTGTGERFDKLDRKVQKASYSMASNLKDTVVPAINTVAQDIEDRYIPAINEFASETKDASGDVVDYFGDMRQASLDTLDDMVSGFFDPIETRFDILSAHRDLEAAKAALAAAKTSTAIHDATNDIVEDLGKQAEGLADLGKTGDLTRADVLKFKKDTAAAYKALGRSVPAELQAIINKLDVLAGYSGAAIDINVRTGVQGHAAGKKRASGGPVTAGEAYMVGEAGPEMFVPDASGSIKPNDRLGGDTYNLTFTGSIGQSADNIIAQVNRMRYYSRSRKAA